ncbi:hypothetical protein [Methylomonas rosea]|uniref:Uncharacterized protein n=1 Tax=Methylomonas rosea TaxID=2952227 RepID=A0ABT1TMX4_9GAMM|nr:hypothetical protein [Methylomonas sp. WSC-7]MCQ8116128.1 hypothetical protein [Methylomonas sp. WSC-7]
MEFVEVILTDEDQRRRSAEWYGDAHYSDAPAPILHRRIVKQKAIAKSRYSAPVAPVAAEIKLLRLQLIGTTELKKIWAIHADIHRLQILLRKMLRARLFDKSVTMDDFSAAAPLLTETQYAGLIAFDFKNRIFGYEREVWEFASLRDALLSLIQRKHPSHYPTSIAHRRIVGVRGDVKEPDCAFVKLLDREYYPPLSAHEYAELLDDGCGASIAVANTTHFLIACTKQGADNAYSCTEKKQ